MCALIAMAVFDTEENQRTKYTFETLHSLFKTVDMKKHTLYIIDNNSCNETKDLIDDFCYHDTPAPIVIHNKKNIGTAEAINLAWHYRRPGEHCIKMDNDVVIHQEGWVEEMEEAIAREPRIGQIGLKRKDLWESPLRTDYYHSELLMLPHEAGQKWIVVENVNHVMGTAVMHSSKLLDNVGYLKQPTIYGFDDSIMSLRSRMSGFINVFLPHINIDHIDTGGTEYHVWKQQHAGETMKKYDEILQKLKSKEEPIYYNPFK